MKSKNYKAFIVEGQAREPQVIENLQKIHFNGSNFKIIVLPAGLNIYMLWKKLEDDDFDTDVIEILREDSRELKKALEGLTRDDFSEIFLFFDYDAHQDNLPNTVSGNDVLIKMLTNFDNETENGKLYISYPMVEALRDFQQGICGNDKDCCCNVDAFASYKQISAKHAEYPDFRKYTFEIWREALNVFAMRISCLYNKAGILKYDDYKANVSPIEVYRRQSSYILQEKIFIISAFPEFLLDYFPARFWNTCIKCSKRQAAGCGKTV